MILLKSVYSDVIEFDYNLLVSRSVTLRDVVEANDKDYTIDTTESTKQLSDYKHLLEQSQLLHYNLLLIEDLLVVADKFQDKTSLVIVELELLLHSSDFELINLYSIACRFQLSRLKQHCLDRVKAEDLHLINKQHINYVGTADLYDLIKSSQLSRKSTEPEESINNNFNKYLAMY